MNIYNNVQEDTIVALATPPGIGAIGVIRLSGAEAVNICNKMFPAKDLSNQPSHTVHYGIIKNGDQTLDEVVVSLFFAPASYTGENVVEISCHGSPYILDQVIRLCINNGCRLAKPGEFTLRAFLNGKMDLTQAEAVADLIASSTKAAHQTALQNLRGGFYNILMELREQLIQFSALIELELDFSQEDVEFADRTRLYAIVNTAEQSVGRLLESFSIGNVIKNGVNTVIAGKTNAGKSTLMNTLLNENRAIVSEIAGTTRDTIEEIINIQGILFRLIDTAGIRISEDIIEKLGVGKTMEKIKQAGLVIYLFDVQEMTEEELLQQKAAFEQQGLNYLLVGNKIDQADEETLRKRWKKDKHIIFISARDQINIAELEEKIYDSAISGKIFTESTVITNARHYAILQQVYRALQDIRQGMDNNITSDLLALDIRRCLQYLGEITGQITHEDQLDYIFSKFCIGK